MSDRQMFVDAAEGAAWETPEGRRVIHSRLGGIGADWDAEDVLEHIRTGDEVRWTRSFMRHDLAVRTGEKWIVFEVRRPEEDTAPCHDCHGTGDERATSRAEGWPEDRLRTREPCKTCGGHGDLEVCGSCDNGSVWNPEAKGNVSPCGRCLGTGWVAW